MPWFRRKRKQQELEAAAAVSQEAPPAEPVEQPSTDSTAAPGDPEGDPARRRRRRGTRGGRGRKKPGEQAAAQAGTDAEPTEAAPKEGAAADKDKQKKRSSTRPDRKPGDRTARSNARRRREPPRRAPLPAAKRELLIATDVGEQRVAILEDDRVAEVYLERPERRSIAGNIYLGTVDNVLPGMEAAFVEIGLEKNGFLYVDEIVVPELEGKRHGKKIQDLISRGETILVQAVKDPMKTKGARLTTEISLPGRFLVYVPNGEGLGVSRRLEDAERTRLKEILKEIAPKEGGVIVRTAADGASAEDVERDLVFLQRLWKTIQTKAKSAKAPALIYQEAELPLRIVRDLFAGDFVAAHVDNDRTLKRIVGYLKKTSPHMLERVHRYKEKTPLFEAHGVEAEIRSTLERRVDLPSGGYLVFDYAEAFTVIDVNTGRFVGSRSKTSNARLEDTIVKNNLEAVKEVVRQLRLRDIGGIIVIDFIDMANPKNRESVEEALAPGARARSHQDLRGRDLAARPRRDDAAERDGRAARDPDTQVSDLRGRRDRRLRAHVRDGRGAEDPHARRRLTLAGVHDRVAPPGAGAARRAWRLATGRARGGRQEALLPRRGRRERACPSRSPAGALGGQARGSRPHGFDRRGGPGRGEAGRGRPARRHRRRREARRARRGRRRCRKLVGKKAKVVVHRVLDGVAFAELVSGGGEAPSPITFESEAEKPTRAPSRAKKKDAETEDAAGGAGEEDTDEEETIVGASGARRRR